MFAIVWKYHVADAEVPAFESAYGPAGAWVQLFGTAPGYAGTDLVRGEEPGHYLTIDRWHDRHDFETFMHERGAEYRRLDTELESLTDAEHLVARGHLITP